MVVHGDEALPECEIHTHHASAVTGKVHRLAPPGGHRTEARGLIRRTGTTARAGAPCASGG
nr:hypothetical protein StreXyl84_21460 [Streptomyces sp. Xyl84]